MAGELKGSLLHYGKQLNELSSFRPQSKPFKAAAIAAVASTAGEAPDCVTPRKYIKVLHQCVRTLDKHRQKLAAEVLQALKELDTVVKDAAHTHSAGAKGKLHYFLQEDLQVQRLQCAAVALHSLVSSLVKLSSYQAPDLKTDVLEVSSRLSSSRCTLPAHQLQLIEEFRSLAWQLDPAAEISDGTHKSAEQVVRKVIIEVHGPFFNAEILDKELTHLEKAARHLDPVAQRAEAATVKLLASALLQLDGDEPVDDDYDSLAPSSGIDPFSVPSFAPLIRVVDPGVAPPSQQPAGMKQLTIQLAGDDNSPASSPNACGTGWYSPLQHLQQQHGALVDIGPASPGQPAVAGAADSSSYLGSSIAGSVSSSRLVTAAVMCAGAAAVMAETSVASTATTVGGPKAAAAAAAAIADAAAAAAAGTALDSSTTANSIASPGAAAAAWAATAAAGTAPSPSMMTIPSSSVAEQQQQQRQRWAAELQQQRQQQLQQGTESADAQPADSPSAAAAAAAPSHLLDEFIASSSNNGSRDSRKACVFHAQMRLPPEGLQRLAGFLESTARVRGFSLAHNWIGPEGMQRLCEAMRVNKSVRMLDLQDNKLGDSGACALAALIVDGAKLSSLQLCANDIGDDGMVALAQAISKARCLEKLSIYDNSIGARGCQALTAAVAATPALKVVEFLPGNCAPTKDVKALARAVKANRKFNICHLFGKQRDTYDS